MITFNSNNRSQEFTDVLKTSPPSFIVIGMIFPFIIVALLIIFSFYIKVDSTFQFKIHGTKEGTIVTDKISDIFLKKLDNSPMEVYLFEPKYNLMSSPFDALLRLQLGHNPLTGILIVNQKNLLTTLFVNENTTGIAKTQKKVSLSLIQKILLNN